MDQAIYYTSVVSKYLDTVTIKENSMSHKNNLPHDTIFTKEDASVSDEQGEVLSRYYNIHYRACVVSLVYISSKKVDSCFAVHKLEKCHRIPVKYTLRVWYTF